MPAVQARHAAPLLGDPATKRSEETGEPRTSLERKADTFDEQDGRHSPQDVLRGVLARTLPAPTLARIFFAPEFTRHLDRSGYIRFRRWR